MRRQYLGLALFLVATLPADLRANGAGDALRLTLPDRSGAGITALPQGGSPAAPMPPTTGTAPPTAWGDNCGYIPPEARDRPNS